MQQFLTNGTPHDGITGQGGFGDKLVGAIGALAGFEIGSFDDTLPVKAIPARMSERVVSQVTAR